MHDDSLFYMITVISTMGCLTVERVSFAKAGCPIARSLERVGEWWSILIMRDALNGLTRFDEFQKSLGIAPNMLTRRLNALVEAGLLERRRYRERPPRDESLLTERGRAFRSVVLSLGRCRLPGRRSMPWSTPSIRPTRRSGVRVRTRPAGSSCWRPIRCRS